VGPVGFTIADGATDFISGDTFNIDVSAVTYKYKLVRRRRRGRLGRARRDPGRRHDATAADKVTNAYFVGQFNSRASRTARATRRHRARPLRTKGIHLIDVIGA
jgi:hypothetical protein